MFQIALSLAILQLNQMSCKLVEGSIPNWNLSMSFFAFFYKREQTGTHLKYRHLCGFNQVYFFNIFST